VVCTSRMVIMPKHVHVLLDPKTPLPEITQTPKGYTAFRANRILDRNGHRFWLGESFDPLGER